MAKTTYRHGSYDNGLFKKGRYWRFCFRFNGAPIQQSSHSTSKTVARQVMEQRKAELVLGVSGVQKRRRAPLFSMAAKEWLESKTALTPLGKRYYRQYVGKLTRELGNRLVSDLTAGDIAALQQERLSEGLSNRQSNAEVATLRAILRKYKVWAGIADDVKMLKERTGTGKALNCDEEERLLDAIAQSPSPSLYPFFILSLDAGLRPSETRRLRRRDLRLKWENGAIAQGEIVVSASKTDAGTGRVVPLTRRACAALSLWLARVPRSDTGELRVPTPPCRHQH